MSDSPSEKNIRSPESGVSVDSLKVEKITATVESSKGRARPEGAIASL